MPCCSLPKKSPSVYDMPDSQPLSRVAGPLGNWWLANISSPRKDLSLSRIFILLFSFAFTTLRYLLTYELCSSLIFFQLIQWECEPATSYNVSLRNKSSLCTFKNHLLYSYNSYSYLQSWALSPFFNSNVLLPSDPSTWMNVLLILLTQNIQNGIHQALPPIQAQSSHAPCLSWWHHHLSSHPSCFHKHNVNCYLLTLYL